MGQKYTISAGQLAGAGGRPGWLGGLAGRVGWLAGWPGGAAGQGGCNMYISVPPDIENDV